MYIVVGIGSLLHKMDIFMDAVSSRDLSPTIAIKHLELNESLRFMKSYFLAQRFPEEVTCCYCHHYVSL